MLLVCLNITTYMLAAPLTLNRALGVVVLSIYLKLISYNKA
jgi:hypothetical protein